MTPAPLSPPVADPDTAALIANLRAAVVVSTSWRNLMGKAADELTRLSALSQAAHEATQALVAQTAETERRCAQIRHLQDGLREALAENRRKDETIAGLRWFAARMINEYREAGPETEEWATAAGLMDRITVNEPCGNWCACVEYGFPVECYRVRPEIATAFNVVGPTALAKDGTP